MPNEKRLADLWKRKDDYIASRLDWLGKKVGAAQADFLETLVSDYMGEFSVDENGRLKSTTGNIRMAIKLDRFFDSLDESKLRAINTQFGKDMLKLTPLSGRYYTALGEPKDVIQSIAEKVGYIEQSIGIRMKNPVGDNFLITQKYDAEIIKGGYLDTITRMPEVREELKQYVVQSVNTKKGYSEYLRGMKEIVKGTQARDGMMERYYRQFAYDTFNNTDASINKHYADNLDLTWFIYQGSLIDTSRPFCRKRAGKVYNTQEAEKWKCDPDLIGKPRGKKCDDSYNPLIERGRYNCRHTIRYIPEDMACQMGRDEACEE